MNQIVICNEKWTLYDNHQQSAQWLNAEQDMPKSNFYLYKVLMFL